MFADAPKRVTAASQKPLAAAAGPHSPMRESEPRPETTRFAIRTGGRHQCVVQRDRRSGTGIDQTLHTRVQSKVSKRPPGAPSQPKTSRHPPGTFSQPKTSRHPPVAPLHTCGPRPLDANGAHTALSNETPRASSHTPQATEPTIPRQTAFPRKTDAMRSPRQNATGRICLESSR